MSLHRNGGPELTLQGFEYGPAGKPHLGPLSFSLSSPGITCVMGPNGAGKSLFLSGAHGLLDEAKGSVFWNGVPASVSRADRGFVFQNTPILRRSVAGNIALPLHARRTVKKLGKIGKEQRISKALADARLDADPRKPAAALSGGERKRLALARAIVTDPKVLLLDEPAANLDPASTAELEDILRNIAAKGVKILISTHDIAQARRLADDVLFFDNGFLVDQALAETFFEAPQSPAAQKYLKGQL